MAGVGLFNGSNNNWSNRLEHLMLKVFDHFGVTVDDLGDRSYVLTPALEVAIGNNDPASAIIRLRWSLLAEGSAAFAILALVAWFGTLEPLADIGS